MLYKDTVQCYIGPLEGCGDPSIPELHSGAIFCSLNRLFMECIRRDENNPVLLALYIAAKTGKSKVLNYKKECTSVSKMSFTVVAVPGVDESPRLR